MRIIITNGFCYTYEGGTEKKLREFIPRLLKLGFSITFISPVDGVEEESLIEGVEHIFLPSKKVRVPKISPPELQLVLPLKKFCCAGDVVHNFNEYFGSFIQKFIKQKPIIHYQQNVLTLRNSYKVHVLSFEFVEKTVLKAFFRRCDYIVSLSNFIGKEMKEKFGVNPITTIPQGIDENVYKNSRRLGKKFRERWGIDKSFILGVGRIVREKGFQELLKIASYFDDVTVGIAGEGYFADNLKRMGKKLGVDLRIFGWLREDDLIAAYSASDFVVVPSLLDEPFGIVNIEALSCSKPVLASRNGGIPEIIDDGINGFLVDVLNREEFRKKFELLLNNKRLRIRMGRNGRKKVKKYYRWKVVMRRWKEVYEMISG